jgi:hypothetical protein
MRDHRTMSYSIGLLVYHAWRTAALLLLSRQPSNEYTKRYLDLPDVLMCCMRWGEMEWGAPGYPQVKMAVNTELWVWTQYEEAIEVLAACHNPQSKVVPSSAKCLTPFPFHQDLFSSSQL